MLNDLTEDQKKLGNFMSVLSEEAYTAGWMEGLEFALWKAMNNQITEYARLKFTKEHIEKLKSLSSKINGWIIFDDKTEETFVTFEEWEKIRRKKLDLLTSTCFNVEIEKVKWLSSHLDVNQPDNDGHIAIDSAINGDSPEVVEILIKNGADLNLPITSYNEKGLTPLHVAIEYANDAMNQNNKDIMYKEHELIIRMLIFNGSDYNLLDESGDTPLCYAHHKDLCNKVKGWINEFDLGKI
jgi:ankyrin repeat protein